MKGGGSGTTRGKHGGPKKSLSGSKCPKKKGGAIRMKTDSRESVEAAERAAARGNDDDNTGVDVTKEVTRGVTNNVTGDDSQDLNDVTKGNDSDDYEFIRKVDSDVSLILNVPDLPSIPENKKSVKDQTPGKVRKSLLHGYGLQSPDDPFQSGYPDTSGSDIEVVLLDMDEESAPSVSKAQAQPQRGGSWLNCRLALSQQASRFTLPMDMRDLENMSPAQYLSEYCFVMPRRLNLYKKVFFRMKNNRTGAIDFKDLERSLKSVLVNTITTEHVKTLCEILDVNEDSHIDTKFFSGIAAFAERMLYPQFITDETADLPQFQRDKIECADFCALDWKLRGVNVNPFVKKMLKMLE